MTDGCPATWVKPTAVPTTPVPTAVPATPVPTAAPTEAPTGPEPTAVPGKEPAFAPLCYFGTDAEAGTIASYASGSLKLQTEGQILPEDIYAEEPVGARGPTGRWGYAGGEAVPLNGGSDDGNSTPGGQGPTPVAADAVVTGAPMAASSASRPAVVRLPATGVGGGSPAPGGVIAALAGALSARATRSGQPGRRALSARVRSAWVID